MKIQRLFTNDKTHIFTQISWKTIDAEIKNADGSIVFIQKNVQVPSHWSQDSTNVLAQKYFRKTGVPKDLVTAPDMLGLPNWLTPCKPMDNTEFVGETSAHQVFHRLAGHWTYTGYINHYFDTPKDAEAFYTETYYMLAMQYAAPNSPQFFNTGLWWAYGIEGPNTGQWRCDKDGVAHKLDNSYEHPQIHACQPPWALISTPRGPIPISQLQVGDQVFDKDGLTKVTNIKNQGVKKVLRIEVFNGNYIEVTDNHPVLTCPKYDHNQKPNNYMCWLTADELCPEMRLLQRNDTELVGDSNSLDLDKAFLAGFLQGDGYQSRSKHTSPCIEFMSVYEEEHTRLISAVENVFKDAHYNVIEVDNNSGLDIKRVRLYGKNLLPFLDEFELTDERWAENMRVPNSIMIGGYAVACEYLRAFFQAEGCVRVKPTSSDVILVSISKYLLEDIQHLLLNLGIYSRLMPSYEKRENRKPCYALLIAYESEREKFLEHISFLSRDKLDKLNNTFTHPGKRMPNSRLEKITEITTVGDYVTWDIETESHNYLTNNIVVHNCFLTPVSDDLVNPGGIMDLWVREAKIFKHGGGSGTNISDIRAKGEPLSGGGVASGVMSFLRIGDSAAGAIASGGTTRRAAVMRCIDIDHPEVEDFISWKVDEESKATAMWVGSNAIANHKSVDIPQQIFDRLEKGFEPEIYGINFEGEAINTVGGQNSNNSIRVTDKFLAAVENVEPWELNWRNTTGVAKTISARKLWNDICRAAWACADPGLIFHDTVNTWNTCKADGEIRTTNPCAEFHHLDNSACNLASLNLKNFLDTFAKVELHTQSFIHAVRLWTIVLDISVTLASFPTKEFAEGAYKYRTLGLGYANLGGLLNRLNLRYDSDVGRQKAAAITALMHMESYRTSNEMAKELGAFPRYEANKNDIHHVLEKHQKSLSLPMPNDISTSIMTSYRNIDFAYGFRNAQTTLIAPTGTIAIIMGCTDNGTTGIEPYTSRATTKNLSGGGTMEFNHSVPDEDCALPTYAGGPCLSPLAHIKMVAAVQPFLSGAVSKTINMPQSATIEDVSQIYLEAHKLGLKSIAIYRDGSKLAQPLNVRAQEATIGTTTIGTAPNRDFPTGINSLPPTAKLNTGLCHDDKANTLSRGNRERLPSKRRGHTQKMRVENDPLYLHTGEYEDGRLGEIFVTLGNEGSTLRSVMEGFAKAISIGIQYGVPLSEYVDAFINTRFEPAGIVREHDRIRLCSSILDLIFRDLAIAYLDRSDLAHIAPQQVLEEVEKVAHLMQQNIRQDQPQLVMIHKENISKSSGEICTSCGNATIIQTGTCKTCTTCGNNSGCG